MQDAKELIGDAISTILESKLDKGDAFWKNNEVRMLTGLFALMFDMEEAGILTEEQVSLNTAFQLTTDIKQLCNFGHEYGKSEYYDLYFKETVQQLHQDPNNKTIGGVIMGIQGKLQLFEMYKGITSRDDFHLIDINKDKNIIYLMIPDEDFTSYKLAGLLIEQFYKKTVKETAKHETRKTKRPIKIIWDELTNFPKIDSLKSMIRMARSRGFQLFFAVQDRSSLEVLYGQSEADTIIKNCLVKIGLKLETTDAKYFSDLIGTREARKGVSMNTNSDGVGISTGPEDRTPILMPEEVQRFDIIKKGGPTYSESIVFAPDSQAVVKNPAWFLVQDELVGGFKTFDFDVFKTYYGPGSEVWQEEKKLFIDEIEVRKKQ